MNSILRRLEREVKKAVVYYTDAGFDEDDLLDKLLSDIEVRTEIYTLLQEIINNKTYE